MICNRRVMEEVNGFVLICLCASDLVSVVMNLVFIIFFGQCFRLVCMVGKLFLGGMIEGRSCCLLVARFSYFYLLFGF